MEKILNFMIYKEQGNEKIYRIRVIHIYKVDYTFLVDVVWQDVIQHAQ